MKNLSWQSALLNLTLVYLSLHSVSPESTCNHGSQNLQRNYSLPSETDARFLSISTTMPKGVQVIVPEMSFGCSGRITGWTAHTLAFDLPNFIEHLTHIITFQVWRPSDSTPSSYTLVGSNRLHFSGSELANGITSMNSTERAFFSFNKTVAPENEIYFQPGDVLGWYISPQVSTILPPLKPLFRAPLETDNSMVDMFVNGVTLESSTLCNVKETFEVYNTVVPLVSVTYQFGQERPLTEANQVCDTTTTVPTRVEVTTPTTKPIANSFSTNAFSSTSNTSQPRPIRIIEVCLVSIMAATLILHVIMLVLCALNLSATRGIRKVMKSSVPPTSPKMHLPIMLKEPTAKPTKYEMVHPLVNYEMVASKPTYETLDRLEKHDGTKDEHLRMLQPGYDTDSSPELERSSMAVHSSKNGSKDALMI